jgi:sugar phosphate isomerase/epimerase
MRIGVMVDSLQLGVMDGIRKARSLGAEGVQLYAVSGAMAPENLDAAQRRELLASVSREGMVITALCGDPGGHGFADPILNPARIAHSMRIMELAVDLACSVVTTHIGVIPADRSHPRYALLQAACDELGRFGDRIGAHFAIETGPESAAVLRTFIEDLSSGGVRVNLDPANFVMVTGQDPVEAVEILKPYIVHTHAKDGRMLRKTDPEIIYGFFADGGIEDMRMEDYFLETPLGEGQVDFAPYLAALKRVGYDGWLTIERETGNDPAADIGMAIRFLREKLARL